MFNYLIDFWYTYPPLIYLTTFDIFIKTIYLNEIEFEQNNKSWAQQQKLNIFYHLLLFKKI